MAKPARLPFTGKQLLAVAEREIGYVERPSNRTKYGVAFGQDGLFWCAVFVWWCFCQLGFDLRKLTPAVASTNELDRALAAAGWEAVPAGRVRAGDVLFYDLGVTGPGDPPDDDDHVEICARRAVLGSCKAVGGNTSPDKRGSQRNGGGVYLRTRSTKLIRRAYRPPYATAAEVPAAAGKPVARRRAQPALAAAKPAKTKATLRAGAGAALLAGGIAVGAVATPAPPALPEAPAPAASAAATASPAPSATVAPGGRRPVFRRELAFRRGVPAMRGADVAAVQRLVGLTGREVDGEYGPGTAAAVRRWQARTLKASGAFDAASAGAAGWRVL
jgi:hypothetical protein